MSGDDPGPEAAAAPTAGEPRPGPAAAPTAGDPRAGAVAGPITAELPGLSLWWLAAPGAPGPVGAGLQQRLRALSDRLRGVDAVTMRTRPVVSAYRAFARQIGLDPDRDRVPAERAALARLMHDRPRSCSS